MLKVLDPPQCIFEYPAGAVAFEPFVGNGRSGDIAAQPLALVALVRPHRYAGVQAESAHIAGPACLRRAEGQVFGFGINQIQRPDRMPYKSNSGESGCLSP